MLRDLLLVLNMLVCLALIGVVLMQRSEGGAFGTGSPTGLVTARGAGDLLTRTTWVLFTLFLTLSLALTLVGGRERSSQAILQRLKNVSVNPDLLAHPTPAPNAPPAGSLPAGANPAGATPPALQLPALGSTATPTARPVHAARATPAMVRPATPATRSRPETPATTQPSSALALPPLSAPSNPTNLPPPPTP